MPHSLEQSLCDLDDLDDLDDQFEYDEYDGDDMQRNYTGSLMHSPDNDIMHGRKVEEQEEANTDDEQATITANPTAMLVFGDLWVDEDDEDEYTEEQEELDDLTYPDDDDTMDLDAEINEYEVEELKADAALDDDELITIYAGKDTETLFYVHKKSLIKHSQYFAGALSGNWKEARDKSVRLPDMTAGFMRIFIHFVYSERLDMDLFRVIAEPSEKVASSRAEAYATNPELSPEATHIQDLIWKMADMGMHVDYLCCSGLQNAIITYFCEHFADSDNNWYLTIDAKRYVYSIAGEESCLREWVVDTACAEYNAETDYNKLPTELHIMILTKVLGNTKKIRLPEVANMSKYFVSSVRKDRAEEGTRDKPIEVRVE